jgi:hypothetical protein
VQRAVAALEREDVVERARDGGWRLAEPFLSEWLDRSRTGLRGPEQEADR